MHQELADNIACRQAPALRADAEALARVVALGDIERLHIHDCSDDASGLSGFSFGSGHQMAVALGHDDGSPAVAVAVRRMASHLANHLDAARACIEQTTLHELAHSLCERDREPSGEVQKVLGHLASNQWRERPASHELSHHHLRWAAALVILTSRAATYRPATADYFWRLTRDDLEQNGHSLQALQMLCGAVDDAEPLRPLLQPGSSLMLTLAKGGLHEHDRQRSAAVDS